MKKNKSKIVFVSTIPPTHCGIATYTEDLIKAITNTFDTIECIVCELVNSINGANTSSFKLNPQNKEDYLRIAQQINKDNEIKLVHIQHEFGLFGGTYGNYLLYFLEALKKPIAFTFHSIIPTPENDFKTFVKLLASYANIIFVMTKQSQQILQNTYKIDKNTISYTPHGTHIVSYEETIGVKKKFNLENRMLLATFGLLSPGKSIETALMALPEIIKHTPNVLYLIIGKTHPNTIINGNDAYRDFLKKIVEEKNLSDYVLFINRYLEIQELLAYLKATDIYLFTSKDPNQAVSGTFTYAMSCACPIVATSIPHTREVLTPDAGILVEIEDSKKIALAVKKLLSNTKMRESMAISSFQKTREYSWENTAVKHVNTYRDHISQLTNIQFKYPTIKLDHIKRLTTSLGIIQFSKISTPDITSGYTLDDNARALIALCMHYSLYGNNDDLLYIDTYLSFIERCQQESGTFINYVDEQNHEHIKNSYVNLEDSNARAVWALGTVISLENDLPNTIVERAKTSLLKCLEWIKNILSPRAIGFSIKGLYLYYTVAQDRSASDIIEKLAKNLMTHYDLNSVKDWKWFENYMTYANSILPEAMLYTYLVTGSTAYKKVAIESFDFLLSKMFYNGHFKVISNNGWYKKDIKPNEFGEQPIDVSYTIQALDAFYKAFYTTKYKSKMDIAFSWFLGKNQLNQMMYDPRVGGCYDGLEQDHVNLNQGAESTVCYLIARLIMENYRLSKIKIDKKKYQLPINIRATHRIKSNLIS